MTTTTYSSVAPPLRYMSAMSQPEHYELVFRQLVEFVRTHCTDDIDALVMRGEFQSLFPEMEEIPTIGMLERWNERPAATPGDPRNEVLAQSKPKTAR